MIDPAVEDSPLTILNVNDDEATRYIVTRILQRSGYTVAEAATGGEALDFVQANPEKTALVVLDINLPDIDGIEVCRRLKADEETSAVPVLHLSASRIGTEDQALGLESGADGYLAQPVDPHVLTATVKALLRMSLSEARARVAAQTWEAIFTAIADGVCLVDAAGMIQHCNPAMAHLLRQPTSSVVGRSWGEVMATTFPQALILAEPDVLDGKSGKFDAQVNQPDEPVLWLRLTIEPLTSDLVRHTNEAGTVRLLADITAIKETDLKQRTLLRDILSSVTENRLRLCLKQEDLPKPFPSLGDDIVLSDQKIRELRRRVKEAAQRCTFPPDRMQDLETAVGEAAMNAVVHTGNGSAQVASDSVNCVQVWIRDAGQGIPLENLHLATLQRGFSTSNTLGHGFWIILRTCDRVWLLTGDTGTTIVLEQERTAPAPAWQT